jgi:hypothetical protein
MWWWAAWVVVEYGSSVCSMRRMHVAGMHNVSASQVAHVRDMNTCSYHGSWTSTPTRKPHTARLEFR